MDRIIVRNADRKDIVALYSLWKELHDLHATYSPIWQSIPNPRKPVIEMFGKFMSTPGNGLFVAEVDGRIAGFISISTLERPEAFGKQRYGYVFDLSVTESMRRSGIGSALFDKARTWFASNRVSRVELSYALANPSSAAFWRKMGFQPYLQRCWCDLDEE